MTTANLRQFDYEKVAKLDTEMWRSYYNHQFFKLFWQLVQLIRTQLGFNWLQTFRLAYYAGWAATDYRLNKGKVKSTRVRKNLIKFFKVISEHAIESFNYVESGTQELTWWDIHRNAYENSPELERSLALAAATMYSTEPENLMEYAHYRAEAMILPKHEGDKKHTTDWQEIHQLVLKAWQSLHAAVQK